MNTSNRQPKARSVRYTDDQEKFLAEEIKKSGKSRSDILRELFDLAKPLYGQNPLEGEASRLLRNLSLISQSYMYAADQLTCIRHEVDKLLRAKLITGAACRSAARVLTRLDQERRQTTARLEQISEIEPALHFYGLLKRDELSEMRAWAEEAAAITHSSERQQALKNLIHWLTQQGVQ